MTQATTQNQQTQQNQENCNVSNANLTELISMGFDEELSFEALRQTNNNIEASIQLLLNDTNIDK